MPPLFRSLSRLGYVGEALAKDLIRDKGWTVSGTCSSLKKCSLVRERLKDGEVRVWPFDAQAGPLAEPEVRTCASPLASQMSSGVEVTTP